MENNTIGNPIESYKKKKRAFFANFALKHLSAFRLHKEFGLLPKTEGWANVSRHCLVEAVAMDVLGRELRLSEKERSNLVQAALLHDFYKRKEIELMKKEGDSMATVVEAEEGSNIILNERGTDPQIVLLTNSVGGAQIERMKKIETTLPEKIMFYIDNITDNDNIVGLKNRIANLPSRYPDIAKTGIYRRLLEVSEEIQGELAGKVGLDNPDALPEYIKTKIREAVESSAREGN